MNQIYAPPNNRTADPISPRASPPLSPAGSEIFAKKAGASDGQIACYWYHRKASLKAEKRASARAMPFKILISLTYFCQSGHCTRPENGNAPTPMSPGGCRARLAPAAGLVSRLPRLLVGWFVGSLAVAELSH